VAGAGVNRSVDIVITVLKAAGDPNPTKPITVTAAGLRTSFSSTAPFTGNITNADGQVQLTVTRNVPNAGTGAINADRPHPTGCFQPVLHPDHLDKRRKRFPWQTPM